MSENTNTANTTDKTARYPVIQDQSPREWIVLNGPAGQHLASCGSRETAERIAAALNAKETQAEQPAGELLPCPFCGRQPSRPTPNRRHSEAYELTCECGASFGDDVTDPAEIDAAWNRRAASAEAMPCGHPASAVVSSEEGTHYCGMCETAASESVVSVPNDEYPEGGRLLREIYDAIASGDRDAAVRRVVIWQQWLVANGRRLMAAASESARPGADQPGEDAQRGEWLPAGASPTTRGRWVSVRGSVWSIRELGHIEIDDPDWCRSVRQWRWLLLPPAPPQHEGGE